MTDEEGARAYNLRERLKLAREIFVADSTWESRPDRCLIRADEWIAFEKAELAKGKP